MVIYIAVLIIIPLVSFLSVLIKDKSDRGKLQLFVYFVILLLISSLRKDTVGGDLARYLPEYFAISNISFFDLIKNGYAERELGFLYIEKLFSIILPTARGYLFWTSLIFLSISFSAIKKESSIIWLTVFLFCSFGLFTNSLNIIRASITISIGLYSFRFIEKRKFAKFLSCVIIAFFIQKTALFLLPIYFLWNIKYSVFRVILLVLSSFVASHLLSGDSFLLFVDNYLQLYELKETSLVTSNSGITPYALFLLFLLIIGMIVYKIHNVPDKRFEFLLYVIATALSIQFFSSIFSLLNRISMFYGAFVIFYIPDMINKFNDKSKYIMYGLTVVIFIIFFLTSMSIDPVTHSDTQRVVPYMFFWQ